MLFDNSDQLNRYVSEKTGGRAILAFSTGKDSLSTWLVMRKYFTTIVPVYMYRIPGISFVERALAYYEDFFQTKIVRLPHPTLYRTLNNLVFQAPENCSVIEEINLPNFDYEDINQIIREDFGMLDCYMASGVKARDSLSRWASIKTHGPLNESKLTFFPIFDFTKADVVRTLYDGKVKLPPDYHMFGRSFDGIDYRFLEPIRKHYPKDYELILSFFPMAEAELKRVEYRKKFFEEVSHGKS